ncbi:hypothetical protein PoB_003394900 [Plakobranchus ocellatus]|uniref:Uncharacterized protein n=1 Tax=Plakobranchus ocellatus TaxID=259542 RepID=A0AAV4AIC7_9GAST|nr:hypothetical protein PoB_003394900 [Plakobranchus ocellatus]
MPLQNLMRLKGGVGGTVDSESALRSEGTLLSRVRAPPSTPWPDVGPEGLSSPFCKLAIYTKPNPLLKGWPSADTDNMASKCVCARASDEP